MRKLFYLLKSKFATLLEIYKSKKNSTSDEKQDNSTNISSSSFVAKPFSVSDTKTIIFSPGNLQYHTVNDEWRFAPSQIDYIGKDNENGWIDLFGWGTGDNPTNSSIDNKDYSTFVDWGINKMANYVPNTWRTLTYEEWCYLLEKRPNAEKLIGEAFVENGPSVIILLPDSWQCPEGLAFEVGLNYPFFAADIDYSHQSISAIDYSKLEASGAVFLPAAGVRCYNGDVWFERIWGAYSSSTSYDTENSYYVSQKSYRINMGNGPRCFGRSVRLVQDYTYLCH